ncbi:hypothetical protein GGI20_003590 [Coemansia sp. BCRC 34301]|nr:hypothetical protein GGI20_003590 [Coemansia sp. BCRC 34301]
MSYAYDFSSPPACISQSPALPAAKDFVHSLQWSPDGAALAAATEEGALEIHDLAPVVNAYYHSQPPPPLSRAPMLSIPHSSAVLAYSWYPQMHSASPATCCLIESVRDHPVQLRDSHSGRVRASYPAMSPMDVLLTASALEFYPDNCFLAGYNNAVARFDLMRPGLPIEMHATSPNRRANDGVKGVVSAIKVKNHLAVCATFAGCLGLFSKSLDCQASWRVPIEYRGFGITQVTWASDHLLWAAQRGSSHLLAWDIRDLRSPVTAIERGNKTGMQRLGVAADTARRHLVTGCADSGLLCFYDTVTCEQDDHVAPSEMSRLSQFMADCMSVGALRGFLHFDVHIRSREEIILRIHHHHKQPTGILPISSLTIATDHMDKVQQATDDSRALLLQTPTRRMDAPPDLSDIALERDPHAVNFLIAGYPRYKCPYVWLRNEHTRLVIPATEHEEIERDVPLRLESIDCWRLYDIRPWDVMVEVICTAVDPPPENPFAIDYGYFDLVSVEERVVVTGAVLEFLRRVYLRHYFFSDVVLADIKRLQKLHFRDINVLREYQQTIIEGS